MGRIQSYSVRSLLVVLGAGTGFGCAGPADGGSQFGSSGGFPSSSSGEGEDDDDGGTGDGSTGGPGSGGSGGSQTGGGGTGPDDPGSGGTSGGGSEGDSSEPGTTGRGSTSGGPDTDGGNGLGTTSGDGSGGTDDSSGIRFDVGDGDTDGAIDPGEDEGCRGVDFLFVVDNSGSMADEQANLINSFPGFIATMEQTLSTQAQDFHVMVVDTDAAAGSGDPCAQICFDAGNPSTFACNGIPCNAYPPPATVSGCEADLGAGRIESGTGTVCGIANGRRYMDPAQPDLPGAFSCAASVGITGNGAELQMEAMVTAISDTMSNPGTCNEGFLRDDALLVVTFITDEEDDLGTDPFGGSVGSPQDWADALIAAKGGDPNAVVVLGLYGDTDQPVPVCSPPDTMGNGAEAGVRLREFVELFGPRGLSGSVCEPDYAPFFAQAVSLIDNACTDWLPPG